MEVDGVDEACDDCPPEQELVPRRYRPALADPGLTFAQPLLAGVPATGRLVQDPHQALPQVGLRQVALAPPRLDVPDPLERYRNPVPLTAFDPEGLLSPVALLDRLEPAGYPVASYLRERLDESTLAELAGTPRPVHRAVRRPCSWPACCAALERRAHRRRGAVRARPLSGRGGLDEATRTLLADVPLPLDLRRVLRRWLLEQALPGEALVPTPPRGQRTWSARTSTCSPPPGEDRAFVVEMTDDRRDLLRFGDACELGRPARGGDPLPGVLPRPGSGPGRQRRDGRDRFRRRAGSGCLDGLTLIVLRTPCRPPAAADPEALDEAWQRAPYSIRRPARPGSDRLRLRGPWPHATSPALLQGAAAELSCGDWQLVRGRRRPGPMEPRGRPPDLVTAAQADLEHDRRVGHALRVAARGLRSARHRRVGVRAGRLPPGPRPARARGRLQLRPAAAAAEPPAPSTRTTCAFARAWTSARSSLTRVAGPWRRLVSASRSLECLGEGDVGERRQQARWRSGPPRSPRVDSRNGSPRVRLDSVQAGTVVDDLRLHLRRRSRALRLLRGHRGRDAASRLQPAGPPGDRVAPR